MGDVLWHQSESLNIYVSQRIFTEERVYQLMERICLEIRNIKMKIINFILTSNHINERLANIIPVVANAQRVFNSVIMP